MARKLKPRTPFAERLISARGTMTRPDFAGRLGLSLTTVAGWERGVSFPPQEALVRISDLLHVSLDWLVAGRAGPVVGPPPMVVDVALIESICEELHRLAAEEGVVLAPRRHGRFAARLYGDLVLGFDNPGDRCIGLRALLPQLRREIKSV